MLSISQAEAWQINSRSAGFTICDRWDVGGVSMAVHPQTGEPTFVVYDGYPGGAGIAELAAAHSRRLHGVHQRRPQPARLEPHSALTV